MGALADCVLDHGYVPYKASAPAAERIVARGRPRIRRASLALRDALDPDRRMNPGTMAPDVTTRSRGLFERLPRLVRSCSLGRVGRRPSHGPGRSRRRLVRAARRRERLALTAATRSASSSFVLPIALRKGGPVYGRRDRIAPRVRDGGARGSSRSRRRSRPLPATGHTARRVGRRRAASAAQRDAHDESNRYAMPFVLAARRIAIERAGGYASCRVRRRRSASSGTSRPRSRWSNRSHSLTGRHPRRSSLRWAAAAPQSGSPSVSSWAAGARRPSWRCASLTRSSHQPRGARRARGGHVRGTLGLGGWRPQTGNLHIERSYLGDGYGEPTAAGRASDGRGLAPRSARRAHVHGEGARRGTRPLAHRTAGCSCRRSLDTRPATTRRSSLAPQWGMLISIAPRTSSGATPVCSTAICRASVPRRLVRARHPLAAQLPERRRRLRQRARARPNVGPTASRSTSTLPFACSMRSVSHRRRWWLACSYSPRCPARAAGSRRSHLRPARHPHAEHWQPKSGSTTR